MHFSLLRYIRRFGLLKGAELYLKPRYLRQELTLVIPGFRQPIYMRGRTSDRQAFQKVFVEGEYAFPLGFTPRVIIDGGANVGYAAIFFAQQFPEALIIAVEPEAENFGLLKRNTATYANIQPVQKALWPRNACLVMENNTGQPDAFRVREVDRPTPGAIPATTVEELLSTGGVNSLDLLKLDIEGAEKELFEAPSRDHWLSRTRALIMEFHDRFKPGCRAAVEQALVGQRFYREQRGENLFLLRET